MKLAEYRTLSIELESMYSDIQKEFAEFQHKSLYHCPNECGKCCVQSQVTCTPWEMLPWGISMLENNTDLDALLDQLKESPQGICINYRSLSPDFNRGYCGQYSFRPTICRTFAITSSTRKNEKVLSLCRHLKTQYSIDENRINELKNVAPSIENAGLKVRLLFPLTAELNNEMSINMAMATILEKLMAIHYYESIQTAPN